VASNNIEAKDKVCITGKFSLRGCIMLLTVWVFGDKREMDI